MVVCRILISSFLLWFAAERLWAAMPPDPETGYIYPPGATAGSKVDVRLGGFNWTPDLEFFVHDKRIKLNVTGKLSRMFLPGAPYLVGTKAYHPPPMPREVTATLSIPADMPPGPVRWQVANANGASKSGVFIVSDRRELVETEDNQKPQRIEQLPVTVSGRLQRHEEIDHYVIRTARKMPITLDVAARRLGGEFNVLIEVRDELGTLVCDAADTRGQDTALTFIADKNRDYTVSLHELDYRGNQAYVYRLSITEGPRVVAIYPTGGQRGTQGTVRFIGYGSDGNTPNLFDVKQQVAFTTEATTGDDHGLPHLAHSGAKWDYENVHTLQISEHPEYDADSLKQFAAEPPLAYSGMFSQPRSPKRIRFRAKKDETWAIRAKTGCRHLHLDLHLALYDSHGKQLAENDDLPETTDAGLLWTALEDGEYELAIEDSSGRDSETYGAVYRLEIVHPQPSFRLRVPEKLNIVQGGQAELTVKAIREDGFAGPIRLSISDLPDGVSVPDELVLPGEKNELKIPLTAQNVSARASLVTVKGTATIDDREMIVAAGALTPSGVSQKTLVAVTMKPRIEISPIESDERTVHRGTTHLAPIQTKRLEGFSAPLTLQVDSFQSFKFRQGLLAPDVVVPAGAESVFFPCFVPQVCETLDAYRMLVIAVAQVPDIDGRTRFLISRMPAPDNSIAITVEGALLRIAPDRADESISIRPGEPFDLPLQISRSPKLTQPLRLEAFTSDAPEEKWAGMDVAPDKTLVNFHIVPPQSFSSHRPTTLVIRAKVLQRAKTPQLDEETHATSMPSELIEILRSGYLPVIAEARVKIQTDH